MPNICPIVKTFLLVCIMMPMFSGAQPDARCATPLYETGFDGERLSGSKEALLQAARQGDPLRVGWDYDINNDKKSELSHWSDAEFITIIKDEVITQVHSIHAQTPILSKKEVDLSTTFKRWHGILNSSGRLQSRFEDSKDIMNQQVKTAWCSASPEALSWHLVYKHDVNGRALEGKKTALINAVRNGLAIQIGWGSKIEDKKQTKSIEHLASPMFITVNNVQEVVAHLPEHVAQQSYWDADKALFAEDAAMWRAIVNTNGRMDAIWTDSATGQIIRRIPQRAAFSWYAQGHPKPTSSLAIKNGVVLDKSRKSELITPDK